MSICQGKEAQGPKFDSEPGTFLHLHFAVIRMCFATQQLWQSRTEFGEP